MNWSLDFGGIVQLVGILLGGIVFLIRVEGKLNILIHEKHMEQEATVRKFTEIDAQLSRLAEAIIQIAKQEVRLDGLDTRQQEIIEKLRSIDEIGSKFTRDKATVSKGRSR